MYKRLMCVLLFVFLLTLQKSASFADNRELIVYYAVGSSSAYRYHSRSTCPSLSRSTVGEFTLEEAVSRGYSPCSRCDPPTADFDISVTPRPKTERSSGLSSNELSPSVSDASFPTCDWSESYSGNGRSSDAGNSCSSSNLQTKSSGRTIWTRVRKVALTWPSPFYLVFIAAFFVFWIYAKIDDLLSKRRSRKTFIAPSTSPVTDIVPVDDGISDDASMPIAAPDFPASEFDDCYIETEDSVIESEECVFESCDIVIEPEESEPPIPENCYIGEDGLPASVLGTEKWGEGYTFYMSDGGRAYHRRGCKVGDRTRLFAVNAYIAKTGYRYYNGPHYFRPCSYCNPVLPDLTWYEVYKNKDD